MVYCSRKCRWDTHNAAKERSREQAQRKMETAALSAMRKLLRAPAEDARGKLLRRPWKNVIVSEVNKKHGTHFEPKWLTRAINNPEGKYHKQFVRVQDGIERLLPRSRAPN